MKKPSPKPWWKYQVKPKLSRDELLSADNLWFHANFHGIYGDIFIMLGYFARCIVAHGLKPWGPVGRQYLVAASSDPSGYDYEHWVTCLYCKDQFRPIMDDATINRFLDYWRDKIEYNLLYTCPACLEKPR